MALWDSADLLQRVRDLIGRPANDPVFTDAFLYRKLTDAEQEWKPILAVHAPEEMWVGPYLMRSIDGKRYSFGDVVEDGGMDDSTKWTAGSGWSVTGGLGSASASSAALSQTPTRMPLIRGITYVLRATVTVSSGSVTPNVGGTAGTVVSATAEIEQEIVCGTSESFGFTGTAFTGSVDDVSVSLQENPLKMLFLRSLTGSPPHAGAYADPTRDYVVELGQVRTTAGREATYVDGAPYIRFVPPAGTIDASTPSTIHPARARILLVYKAAALCCYRIGQVGDPARFEDLMDERWFGKPESGKIGLQGELRAADHYGGLVGVSSDAEWRWWRPNG